MVNAGTEMIFAPPLGHRGADSTAAQLWESKTRMLITTGELRSIKEGRSLRILPEWVEAYVKIAPRQPRTAGDKSKSQRRGLDLPVPQRIRSLRLDHESVRESASAKYVSGRTRDVVHGRWVEPRKKLHTGMLSPTCRQLGSSSIGGSKTQLLQTLARSRTRRTRAT
jgi:hypothetical protein